MTVYIISRPSEWWIKRVLFSTIYYLCMREVYFYCGYFVWNNAIFIEVYTFLVYSRKSIINQPFVSESKTISDFCLVSTVKLSPVAPAVASWTQTEVRHFDRVD